MSHYHNNANNNSHNDIMHNVQKTGIGYFINYLLTMVIAARKSKQDNQRQEDRQRQGVYV